MSKSKKIDKPIHPNSQYLQQNIDKVKNEKWFDTCHNGEDLLNWPSPSRILIIGSPNSGKTMMIKNLLIHQYPCIDNVFILHPECYEADLQLAEDAKSEDYINDELPDIEEYSGVKAIYLRTFPPASFWKQFRKQKNVFVCDDIDIKSYIKRSVARQNIINKLWSYVSTHHKVTIIAAFQDIFSQGAPCIYRFSNVFILFKMLDSNMRSLICRITGTCKENFQWMMTLLNDSHDSICMDMTNDTPCRYRYNLVQKIDFNYYDSDDELEDDEKEAKAFSDRYFNQN